MDGITFIQDLALVLLAAGAAGAICRRLGLSVIVGYVLAGVLIGPHTPPFASLQDTDRVQNLSQVGLVFLMFSIGLGLSLSRLRRMGLAPLIGTALGAFIVLYVARTAGLLAGLDTSQAFFLAAMFTTSSSAVIAKMISDLNLGHDRSGQIALSVTVLEDVVAVVMLTLLGAEVATSGAEATSGVGGLLAGLSAFVVLLVGAGLFLVPKLLRRLDAPIDSELQTIVVAGLLLTMSLLAVKAGYSLALGAFLLGAMVADMPQKAAIERSFAGMRDMFSSVFFVAIGMMIEIRLLAALWPVILGLGVFTILLRALGLATALTLVGLPPAQVRKAALLLTPIGEFSFVIAQLGVSAGVLDARYYPIAVGVSLFTVLIVPLLNRRSEGIIAWSVRMEPQWLRTALDRYHTWMTRQSGSSFGGLWWRLSRKRVLQIAAEMLLVTGMLSFSRLLLEMVRENPTLAGLSPLTIDVGFWSVMGFITLIPLVALWRNIAALAMISAEAFKPRTRLPQSWLEALFKLVAAVVLVIWLLEIVPTGLLPRQAWLAIGLLMVLAVTLLARRMINWHSQWQYSVEGMLAGDSAAGAAATASTPSWWEKGSTWDLQLREVTLPEGAACAGRRIGDLGIRNRFGCAVAEINRGGFVILPPGPDDRLFPGDCLLLLGGSDAIERARTELSRIVGGDEGEFAETRLEVLAEPPPAWIDRTLAELGRDHTHGALIVGIERKGRRQLNPGADDRVRAGDRLLVLATPDQLRALQRIDAGAT